VLNDDTVAGGTGFDLHPHNNMEIISIILEGALEHRDSMGNVQVLHPGEVQVMTAGTGIYHAEYNHSDTKQVKFLQIWIFPREKGLKPRYDQTMFTDHSVKNNILTLVTPDTAQQEGTLWIHQDAYISNLSLQKECTANYTVKIPGNGVYVFIIEGEASIQGNTLKKRDAIGVTDTGSIHFSAVVDSRILLLEVPMK
jgi:redox-sensitive bicupin YhaK (pirin superfamily)